MILNTAGIEGEAVKDFDGLWRMSVKSRTLPLHLNYPFRPDGFMTREQCERWWEETGEPQRCRVCSASFYAARDDSVFCRPACRAKYNRHQQGASERAGTGAYYQRPEEDRTHKRRAETFEYQCEWCGKTNTARAEAERSGQRRPKYCNDNGGRCRQAAYRAAKKAETRDSKGTGHQHSRGDPRGSYRPTGGQTGPTSRANDSGIPDRPPKHSGAWRSASDATAWMTAAMLHERKIPMSAWRLSGSPSELRKFARAYLKDNHPDVTGKPATEFYKQVSDCYSYLRNH